MSPSMAAFRPIIQCCSKRRKSSRSSCWQPSSVSKKSFKNANMPSRCHCISKLSHAVKRVYFMKQSRDSHTRSSWCVKHAVQAAQEKRLNLGVELYGFQQQLAQLQKTCQETESKAAQLAAEREREEPILVGLQEQAAKDAKKRVAQKAEVRASQDHTSSLQCPTGPHHRCYCRTACCELSPQYRVNILK